jgi:hypothetical protein
MTWRNFKSKEPVRPQTNNEKFLLGILAAVVLLGGTFYGYKWLTQKQSSLQLAYATLLADQTESEVDLRESDMWTQRQAWIQANQPALGNEDDAKAEVLTYVLKGARDHKLEIVEQNLGDVQNGAAGTRVNASVKVKGSMEALVDWLTELEKPKDFYAVSLFSLKADQDQKSMVCSLQFARYFKK